MYVANRYLLQQKGRGGVLYFDNIFMSEVNSSSPTPQRSSEEKFKAVDALVHMAFGVLHPIAQIELQRSLQRTARQIEAGKWVVQLFLSDDPAVRADPKMVSWIALPYSYKTDETVIQVNGGQMYVLNENYNRDIATCPGIGELPRFVVQQSDIDYESVAVWHQLHEEGLTQLDQPE